MKRNLKFYAPFGLYLALVAMLVAGSLWIIQKSFTLPVQIALAAAFIGLATWVLLDPQQAGQALTGRTARYGTNAVLMVIALGGILAAVNYLASQSSIRWDLTSDQKNTLTDVTTKVLSSLTEPVQVVAYYSSRYTGSQAGQDLLSTYSRSSGGKLTVEVVDPETNPIRAQEDKVTRDGTVVLKQAGRAEKVTFAGEQELTNALVRLSNPGKRAVYFLTGHGEYSPEDTGETSYASAKTALSAKNYTIATLNLLAGETIPADALALVIAGSNKPVSDQEVAQIKAYMEQGGSLVLLTEPRAITEFGDSPDPLAALLEQSWGIAQDNNMVIDTTYNPPVIAVSAKYGNHPITTRMGNQGILFPSARSLQISTTLPTGVTATALVTTGANSWGETDTQSIKNNQFAFDSSVDLPGPLTLAVAADNASTGARLVVIGDSDFASGSNFVRYGNGDFLINSIDWAAKQDALISLTPRQTTQRFLVIPGQATLGLILFGAVFLIPGVVVIAGISTWLQRRKRG